MPKEEWGVKRVCPTTGKRFYDLNKDPIVSPYTGEVVEFNNEEIERLQEIVARELGYELVDHRLELYGVPLSDKNKSKASAG